MAATVHYYPPTLLQASSPSVSAHSVNLPRLADCSTLLLSLGWGGLGGVESRRGRRSEDQLPFQGQASPVRASISEKGITNRTNFMSGTAKLNTRLHIHPVFIGFKPAANYSLTASFFKTSSWFISVHSRVWVVLIWNSTPTYMQIKLKNHGSAEQNKHTVLFCCTCINETEYNTLQI